MDFTEDLYVGATVEDLGTVVYSLRRRIPVPRLYCIVFFPHRNRLEILSSRELFTPKYQEKNGIIAGVAMGRKEAVDLFCYMAEQAAAEGRDMTSPQTWIFPAQKTDGGEEC